ncbi:rhodanese-like domain-containing protein [Paenibacillus chondroitinus]|uniref:Rhodanese-like domain-containing protein n=1 Tax=Paenibacillus chondroitinus TaxID=59842 RepID=A0ABU6DKY2_9BACL|nr:MULTISPECIES: rhodanese-like domain-containing protein [Paenibacillus]MCY9657156.1 rhodanese-like domain-containing protein [Paenibacillus anseongense]MEB4798439.1 rhodanese-like domain-containing protein [Paenibacillus chondroitinus]
MDYNLLINIAAVIFVVWFVYSRFAGVKGLKQLTSAQFQDELKGNSNKILIDVREPGEVKHGYIAGAKNIPLSQLKQRVSEIPADKTVYLYCRSGMRSKQAARILQKKGFRELAHLQGGIMSWKGKIAK